MDNLKDDILDKVKKDFPYLSSAEKSNKANKHYLDFIKIIKDEISKPEYNGLSDNDIKNLINSPVENTISSSVYHKSLLEEAYIQIKFNDYSDFIELLDIDDKGKITFSEETFESKMSRVLENKIKEDKYNRGYADKKPDELKKMIIEPYNTIETRKIIIPSRISKLCIGIAYAPNEVSIEDIKEAKK